MIHLSHPTGNANVRAVLDALIRAEMLSQFHTTISARKNSVLTKFLPKAIQKEFLRRQFNVHQKQITSHPYREMARLGCSKMGIKYLTKHEKGMFSLQKVYAGFDLAVANSLHSLKPGDNVSAVYCYEDGALATFKVAKRLGLTCIYDLPIAYFERVRSLLNVEMERLPEWAPTLGGGISDSQEKLDRKAYEMELADIVVGPGKFVLDSIPTWAKSKIQIMSPFGSPKQTLPDTVTGVQPQRERLRVLFVGSMGQRKGLGDLFEAIRKLNRLDVELVVLGTPILSMDFYRHQLDNFTFEKSRPHHEVLELMRSCDVFCLPSIAEGRALVMQEAMSQGLPIIITPNTGGEDLVIEGETGFLIPIRSPEHIAERITWFLDNRKSIKIMGQKAKEMAAKLTWDEYGEQIASSLKISLKAKTSRPI